MSKKLLLVGGNGQLGKVIANTFINCKENNWKVISLDLTENKDVDYNIIVDNNKLKNDDFTNHIYSELNKYLHNSKFNSIISVAGGWEGVKLNEKNFISSLISMNNMNFYSAALSANLASLYLEQNSLLSFTSASAVKNKVDCTGMLTYQLSKQSVQNLTDTLTEYKDILLPKGTKLLTICPGVIDTPINRKYMGDQDASKWVKMETIADYYIKWSNNINLAPKETYYLL